MKKYKFKLTIILILYLSCNRHIPKTSINELATLDKGMWITDQRELPASDSLFYLDLPAPVFRKDFSVTKKVEETTLLITAAGYYKATVNGADGEF